MIIKEMCKRGFAPILIVLIVAVLTLGGGVLYYLLSPQKQTTIPTNNLETNNKSFSSKELGISFEYPSELGPTFESPASTGTGGSAIKGEDWVRIQFFEKGILE